MVAMNVWPTDGADGAVANEARWRKMARLWSPSGVAAGIGGELAPTLAGTDLTIQAGACWADGHYCELDGSQVLTVSANGLAVVRFDPAANSAELLYRDAATEPTQNPDGIWEVPIAQLIGGALTDRRTLASDRTVINQLPQLSPPAADDISGTVYEAFDGLQWNVTIPGGGGRLTALVHVTGLAVVTADINAQGRLTIAGGSYSTHRIRRSVAGSPLSNRWDETFLGSVHLPAGDVVVRPEFRLVAAGGALRADTESYATALTWITPA